MAKAFEKRKIKKFSPEASQFRRNEKLQSLPNSLVMRIMEESGAEEEADKLSSGITATTPDALMEEMGGRLGADFSGVNFHSDSASMNKSEALGARAWTQGRDVYFGRGGFDPSVAAHELVHTVQQGAVRGSVSQSMPMGAVQLLPNDADNDDSVIKPNFSLKDSDFQRILTQVFSSDMGARVYKRLEKTLKEMVKKGAGKKPPYTKEKGIEFLALAAGKDYSSRGILSQIVQKDIRNKDAAKDAAYEYEEFIKLLTKRLGNYGLEDVAMQTNLIDQPPKYDHTNQNKRAYETEMPADDKDGDVFNPNNIPELTRIQKEIDGAQDAKTAYSIFAAYTGNPSGKYTDKYGTDLDVSLFKKKLKHMVRVVYDYPELRNNIGDMSTIDPKSTQVMSENGSVGGHDKITFDYNAHLDRKGADAERRKAQKRDLDEKWVNAPNADFAGTHEMGHGLASLLPDSGDYLTDLIDQNNGKNEDSIIKAVINNTDVLTDEEKANIRYFKKDKKIKGKIPVLKGQIDTAKSKLFENDHTSGYGKRAPVEFFAESFHDVYANGKNAKKMSIEIVKEYEKRQQDLTQKRFFRSKKRGIFRRFMDLFKF